MTEPTVSAQLDALLAPLNSVQHDLSAACALAERNKLPRAFLETIRADIAHLVAVWQNINDIATALDPDRGKHEP